MTPDRFIACLDTLGWSLRALAARLGLASHTTPKRWATGEASIPWNVAAWLERRAKAIADDPLPEDWAPRHPSDHSAKGSAG